MNYVLRVKSPASRNSMLSSFASDLPDNQEEFDVEIKRFFTNKRSNIMKEQKDVYCYMSSAKNVPHFKKFLAGKNLRYLKFRVLKIKTGPDVCEYIITNLPYSFGMDDIKDIYHLR